MITRFRLALSLACAAGLARALAADPAAANADDATKSSAEIAALLAAMPAWSSSVALEAGYGFKDNVVLSHADEERSAFARGSVEFLLLRVPTGRLDYTLFGQAEGTRYFSSASVPRETKVWMQTEPAYRIAAALKFSVPVTGYYYDQVFDVSEIEAERLVAELKLRGGMVGPTLRWAFRPDWWIEAQAVGERKRYEDGANDGDVGTGALRLGWSRRERLRLQVSGEERWRSFVRRTRYNTVGREIPDTHLKIREREGEARVDLRWDEAGRWESRTRLGWLQYRDNGSGYFNYREKKIAQELNWKTDAWRVRLEGAARRIDFAMQTVGFGVDPPARLKDEFTAEVRVERVLSKRWTVFADYSWERSRSNDVLAAYVVNEGLLGARWSWEK